MDLEETYPEAWQLLILYQVRWDDEDIDDDEIIAREILNDRGPDELAASIRELRDMMKMNDFPWETILNWSNRSQPDEQATRAWLENLLDLVSKNLAAKVQ